MFDGLDNAVLPHFVHKSRLATWTKRIRPHIEKIAAGSGGRYLPEDVLAALAAGQMHLWVALKGADLMCVMLTEIINYPRARAMRLIALVGHRPQAWRHLLQNIELTARRDFGCTLMEALGSPRYAAILPGYTSSHCLHEKAIA